MIKFDLISIIILISYIVIFLANLSLVLLRNAKNDKSKFLFGNVFPSEIYFLKDKYHKPHKVLNFLYVILSFSPILIIVPNWDSFGGVSVNAILISALMGLLAILKIILESIDIFYVKQHIVISTIYMAVNFLFLALVAEYSFLSYHLWNTILDASVMTLILGIFSAFLALLELILMLNPKLKDWAKLINYSSDENPNFKRPHLFPLAYTEWIFILLEFLGGIVFILSLIKY